MSNLHHNPRTRAFTLTELLVVIAIVVLLLGTLFVAINAASKRAQVAKAGCDDQFAIAVCQTTAARVAFTIAIRCEVHRP